MTSNNSRRSDFKSLLNFIYDVANDFTSVSAYGVDGQQFAWGHQMKLTISEAEAIFNPQNSDASPETFENADSSFIMMIKSNQYCSL